MSTQLKRIPGGYEVSTISAPGGRKKRARGAVKVTSGDPRDLIAEMTRQAEAARAAFGIVQEKEKPVV